MSEKNIFQKEIIKKLRDNSEEIYLLKEKISRLEKENYSYQNKILDLNRQLKELIEIEIKNRNLSDQKKNCENRIQNLEKEIIQLKTNCKTENRQVENQLENEVVFYKGLHETGMAKIDAADNIIKLNNAQNKYIIDLEEELNKLRNNSDETVCKLKIEHDLHFYNLKKKMMDYVKEITHNMSQNSKDNLELNTKLGLLYKNQMLNELEQQALQIRELLIIKEKYEKIIFELKQELDLHKKVEKTVLLKNMKYVNLIKDYNENNFSSDIIENKMIKEKISLSEKKVKKKKKKNKKCKFNTSENYKSEDLDKAQLSIINSIIFNNHYRECKNYDNSKINKKYFDEYISLKKLYDELLKENQNIKEILTTIKDKQKMFNDKYSGILKLYKNALTELLLDEELKNKNINITKEIINSGNYESFTKEQKQIILITLIKDLLPLIDKNYDDSDIDLLRNSFQQSFNFKTSTTLSSKKGNNSSRNNNNNNNITNLSKLNFRSVLDNKICICENRPFNIFEKSKQLKTIYKYNNGINSLKTLNNENLDIGTKINEFGNNKFASRNRSLKLFKYIKNKSNNNKPLRFIYIQNNFNMDYDQTPVITCLTKNNFLS